MVSTMVGGGMDDPRTLLLRSMDSPRVESTEDSVEKRSLVAVATE
jgi:hypothetical protein